MPKRGENIHKRKDGRWEGRYKKAADSSGKTQYGSVYGKTYSEVKAKLKEVSKNQFLKQNPIGKERKFGEVLVLWKETNRLKHKGATESKYEYLIERHIIPELGNLPLSAITTLTLNEFAEKKLTSGRINKRGGLSTAYVRSMMIIVTSALQYAINEGMCPALKTAAFKPTVEKNELRILSPQEQDLFEMFLLSDINETKFGIYLSLNSGLRIGEICALRWNDNDLENQVIHIRSTIARIKNEHTGGTVLIIDSPKTKASLRDVPIHSKLIPIIAGMRVHSKSQYVISNTAKFISPRTYEYRYHRLLEQCGLESYNYHALRHTFATKCIIAGVDVKTLSEILGHSSVSITLNTYVHPSMKMKLNQIEKINAYSAYN